MRTRRRTEVWPYLLLSVALLGALSFGWYQTRQRNLLALDAENQYMSAFHKLKWNSENIEERTAKLMATDDRQMQEALLADLRVYSAQAVENISALPLANMHTPRISSFLNTVRLATDEMHYKLSQGGTLGEQDWARLADLRRQSVSFEDELSNLLGLVGTNMIKWSGTARVTGPAQPGNAATPITKSVTHIEKALAPAPGEASAQAPGSSPEAPPRTSPGPPVDAAAASLAIKRFIDVPLNGEPVLTGSSTAEEEGKLPMYFFNAQKMNGTPLNFGVSVAGGHVIFMIDGRPVRERNFTEEQLAERARQMLRKWGYPSAEFVSAAENTGTLMMDFAPRQDGVMIMTELIKVSLAMDNGELVAFDARNYWVNRHDRKLETPRVSAALARTKLAPRLKTTAEPTLAVVADQVHRERLAWEFRAEYDTQRYLVYIDAVDGREINVLRIAGDPAPPLNE